MNRVTPRPRGALIATVALWLSFHLAPVTALEQADRMRLLEAVRSFADAVRVGDDASVRAHTCAAAVVPACVARELALAVDLPQWYLDRPQPDPQALVSALDLAYLDAIRREIGPLVASGAAVAGLSVVGVRQVAEVGERTESLLPLELSELALAAPIAAQGTVTLKFPDGTRSGPITVFQVGDEWCLKPVHVPSLRDL